MLSKLQTPFVAVNKPSKRLPPENAQSEFYGKEFALFSDGDQPHSLKAVLEARPDR